MKFAFIRDHQTQFPVEIQCNVLGVSRSGFYAWRKRPSSTLATRRTELVAKIHEVHNPICEYSVSCVEDSFHSLIAGQTRIRHFNDKSRLQ